MLSDVCVGVGGVGDGADGVCCVGSVGIGGGSSRGVDCAGVGEALVVSVELMVSVVIVGLVLVVVLLFELLCMVAIGGGGAGVCCCTAG